MLVKVTGLQKVTKVIEIEDGKKLEGNTNFDEIEKYLFKIIRRKERIKKY